MNKQQALNKIELLKKELDELQKIVDKPTISKEERFLQLIDGLTVKIDQKKYPNSVFLFKGNHFYFEIEKTYIWCSYYKVWSVFEKEYEMEYADVQVFIKDQLEEHFKIKDLTSKDCGYINSVVMEEYFKMKGLTSV